MTIPTQQATEIFLGNGVTNTFDFTFVGAAAADISVVFTDANANVTTLNPSQYTIFLNAPAVGSIWGVGGTVTYPTAGSPIANGTSLTVSRTLPLTQDTSISNQGDFFPQSIETALDILEMQIQQVSGRTGQFRGEWATGITYNFGDYAVDGANGGNTGSYYMAVIANFSTNWATQLAAGDWVVVNNFITINALNTAVASATASANAAAASATAASGSATSASTSASTATTASTAAVAAAALLSATVHVVGASATPNIDLSTGRNFKYTTAQNCTFTFSSPDATGNNCSFVLFLFQDSTGRTITWPASVKWSNGIVPTLSAANAKYTLTFTTIDGGITYDGYLTGEAFA